MQLWKSANHVILLARVLARWAWEEVGRQTRCGKVLLSPNIRRKYSEDEGLPTFLLEIWKPLSRNLQIFARPRDLRIWRILSQGNSIQVMHYRKLLIPWIRPKLLTTLFGRSWQTTVTREKVRGSRVPLSVTYWCYLLPKDGVVVATFWFKKELKTVPNPPMK